MTYEEKQELADRINQEGFDYCFIHYSDFKEYKDKKFHKLREAYIKAHRDLANHLGLEE